MGKVYTKSAYISDMIYGEDNDTSAVSIVEYKQGKYNDVYVLTTANEVVVFEFNDEDDYNDHAYRVVDTVDDVENFLDIIHNYR